jgi:hypothetical protein
MLLIILIEKSLYYKKSKEIIFVSFQNNGEFPLQPTSIIVFINLTFSKQHFDLFCQTL